MKKIIAKKSTAKIDYIEIRKAENLETIKTINGKVFIGVAAYFGKTRLIDNIIV
jgi:pantoate--beta-alanine ligase